MEPKEKRTKAVYGVLVLAGLSLVWTLATAGNLEPSAPPAPTMKTLDEIYNAVIASSSGIAEREGYMKGYEIAADSNETFFTVPAGKRFVLLKLNMDPLMYLTIDDNLFIDWSFFHRISENLVVEDFPDRCVVVNAGETLKAVNAHSSAHNVAIVGYFYDVP